MTTPSGDGPAQSGAGDPVRSTAAANHKTRSRMARLRRRAEHLEARSGPEWGGRGFDHAEAAALRWALRVLDAAIECGCHELLIEPRDDGTPLVTSPVTPDEPESARSEDREAAPRTDVDALAVDLGQTHDHEIGLHDRFEAVFRGQAEALIARGWTARGDLSTAWEAADGWERLRRIQSELNALRSDGPFMDTLTAEGPWWTAADPAFVALYEAIIAASDALDSGLMARSTEQGGAG